MSESRNQTILVGESIYLRSPALADAASVMTWLDLPWPMSARRAEAWLEKEVPGSSGNGEWRLIACRRSDDAPVGSAWINEKDDAPCAWVRLHAGPLLDAGSRESILAEMLGIIVGWLGGEVGAMAIEVDLVGSDSAVLAAADALGMRRSYRLREGFWRDGALHDWVTVQWFNPAWLERIGDPGPGIALEGAPPEEVKSPAPLRWKPSPFPMPANAVIASERLALRPFEPGDSDGVARSLIEDPESGFGHARTPVSPIALSSYHAKAEEQEPPDEVEFAIVLRETGEVIGDNGIYYIDWLSRTAETGTWIYRPEHRGGGLGTEAKHLLLEWTFERARINMVWSWVFVGNERSAAALRKQGYRNAGRLDWVGMTPTGLKSAWVFDLLAEEWRAARR
jgi:RimJ/RimL family protein N-acetyltransferase